MTNIELAHLLQQYCTIIEWGYGREKWKAVREQCLVACMRGLL